MILLGCLLLPQILEGKGDDPNLTSIFSNRWQLYPPNLEKHEGNHITFLKHLVFITLPETNSSHLKIGRAPKGI